MAPKPKAKKKTKEELEEERRKAEEEARLAEEARLKELEEQRRRQEAEEAARQARETQQRAQETDRLLDERQSLVGLLASIVQDRALFAEKLDKDEDWKATIACSPLPRAAHLSELNDYLSDLEKLSTDPTVSAARLLALANDSQDVLRQIENELMRQLSARNYEKGATLLQYREALSDRVTCLVDQAGAHIMFRSEEFADADAHVQVSYRQQNVQFGLWMNIAKNPRLRALAFPEAKVAFEIPKQIALASVALRLYQTESDRFFYRCTNHYRALGGILTAELVTMPSVAKKIKSWTLRPITPLSTSLQRVPYPIPPAGADAATIAALEAAPVAVQFHSTPHLFLPEKKGGGPRVQVAYWDEERQGWRTEGITDQTYDPETGKVSFTTLRIGPMALVVKRTALLPYRSWNIRPTRGRGGNAVALQLCTALPDLTFEFECSESGCRLLGPALPHLADLTSALAAEQDARTLLGELSRRGFHLMPEDRDSVFCGCAPKDQTAEETFCEDLALISNAFLIASARFNQYAGREDCIARVSEVVDWEGGGRTEAQHVDRIFAKERQDRPNRVLSVMQRGSKGVCFVDALDTSAEMLPPPAYGSEERFKSIYGEMHASLLTLLRGTDTEGLRDTELAQKLRASPEALQLAAESLPRMTQVLSQLLVALRVFSFGTLVGEQAEEEEEPVVAEEAAPPAPAVDDVPADGAQNTGAAAEGAGEGSEAEPTGDASVVAPGASPEEPAPEGGAEDEE